MSHISTITPVLLFLGVYKHPEVLKSELAIRPIQYGVMYAPDLHFIVFDIAIYHSKSERGELYLLLELM